MKDTYHLSMSCPTISTTLTLSVVGSIVVHTSYFIRHMKTPMGVGFLGEYRITKCGRTYFLLQNDNWEELTGVGCERRRTPLVEDVSQQRFACEEEESVVIWSLITSAEGAVPNEDANASDRPSFLVRRSNLFCCRSCPFFCRYLFLMEPVMSSWRPS